MDLDSLRLETDRLVLRPTQAQDFEGWAAFFADAESTRHMGGPRTVPLAWRHFLAMTGARRIQGHGAFSIIDKANGQWIGWSGLWYPIGWPGPEIGWCLAREAWGKGYAFEAATAAMSWAFNELGWDEVIHLIPPDNHASQAVAKRLGSSISKRIEMAEPFEGEVVDVWMQTCEQWRRRHAHA